MHDAGEQAKRAKQATGATRDPGSGVGGTVRQRISRTSILEAILS